MSRMSIAQFASIMGHDVDDLIDHMKQDRVLKAFGRPYQEHVNRGYFIVANLRQRECNALLTDKGQIWMARKYPHGLALGATR